MTSGRSAHVVARTLGAMALATSLLLLLSPLIYATWISFTPAEILTPPAGEWSLRWYRSFFSSPQWTLGLEHSFRVAFESVALAIVGGLLLAFAVVRARFRGAGVLESAVRIPLFVPSVVLGMGLLPLMRTLGLWGTTESIAVAHAVITLPVVFLVARTAVLEADVDLERAARGLGAGALLTFRRVTFPLMAPAIAIAAAMAFILSLNEFVVALFLGTAENETLPKVIWPSLRYTLTPLVAAASGLTLAVTIGGLALCTALLRLARRR